METIKLESPVIMHKKFQKELLLKQANSLLTCTASLLKKQLIRKKLL